MRAKTFIRSRVFQLVCVVSLLAFLPACPIPDECLEAAYQQAIADAAVAEPDEISHDLTPIVDYNEDLIRDNGRVLVVAWTDWTGYDALVDQTIEASRDIWVTVAPEVQQFCDTHFILPSMLTLRLEQLLGLPPDAGKTRFVEFWVEPDELFRPSPDPEVTDREAELGYPVSADYVTVSEAHIQWITDLEAISYLENGYPWTRLGYTYDWGNPCSEIGLSEYVIPKGAVIEVHSVTLTDEYCGVFPHGS